MFCGLPMIVATDPALAAKPSASRNGTGLSFRAPQALTRSGAIATATTLLVRNAESPPTARMITASSASGLAWTAASRAVTAV